MVSADESTTLIFAPLHTDIVRVNFQPGSFLSSLRAIRPFQAGSRIAQMSGCARTSVGKRYTTVQVGCGDGDHVELNCEFVYMNHACLPTTRLVVETTHASHLHDENGEGEKERGQEQQEDVSISVWAVRDIPAGGDLTFDYCTTEWVMDQPFDCSCRAAQCRGRIAGAWELSPAQLDRIQGVNAHILVLKQRQQEQRQQQQHGETMSS